MIGFGIFVEFLVNEANFAGQLQVAEGPQLLNE